MQRESKQHDLDKTNRREDQLGQQAASKPAFSDSSLPNTEELRKANSDLLNERGIKVDVVQAVQALQADVGRLMKATPQQDFGQALNKIILQLAPLQELASLQELAPRRTPLEIGAIKSLEKLRKSQKRPDWTGAGSLSVQEKNVPFIGEVR